MEINREIEDLHGHKFTLGAPNFCPQPPYHEFGGNTDWIFTKDKIRQQTFILVRIKDINNGYGYIFWENGIYVYGLLTLISYNPDKDMRYEKEKK